MSYFLGIDLGTSSVKICLTDAHGNMLKEACQSYELAQPAPGWKEIDPEIWWDSTCTALEILLKEIDVSRIIGIGVTGQMHTVVMLDENGQSIRPALMWNDTRAAEYVSYMKEQIKDTEIGYINRILSTGSPAANLYWLKREEPDHFSRLRKFLIGPDYIVYRLTGIYGTDYCEASTSSLYDTFKKEWSPTMQKLVGLNDDVYPEVKGSAEVAGCLLPELAQRFGIREEAIVITGTGDNPAASIPTGCLGNHYPVFSMGTSGVLMFPRERLDYRAKGKNILFGFNRDDCNVLVQGVVQSCGSSLSWWNTDILNNSGFSVDSLIDPEKLGDGELLFYPHLTGDKTIYADPYLRGAFIGLGTDTTKDEMTLAVLEGIAFGLKELAGEMHLEESGLQDLKVIGGGSKSRLWMQILADVMDLPIAQMGGQAGAGYGMALLAAYACGEIRSIEEISENAVKVKEYFYPRPKNAEAYRHKFERYMKVHDALKVLF